MKKLEVKKLKRRCMVRGCNNLDTFSINRTGENGNTIIICRECLKDALGAISEYKEEPKKEYAIPSLFFSGAAKPEADKKNEVAEPVENSVAPEETETDADEKAAAKKQPSRKAAKPSEVKNKKGV